MSHRVIHPEHGRGEVVTLRRGGRVAIVDFESRPMPTHVHLKECRDVGDSEEANDQESSTAESTPSMRDVMSTGPEVEGTRETSTARLTLEAMRLGVVPSSNLDVYTVGRDVEMGLVEADLERFPARDDGHGSDNDCVGAVRAWLGEYGTGKTHLLELIRQRALDRGFLVARVVLDPRETKPNHPKRIYRELIRDLTYPERPSDAEPGLRPLLTQAIESPDALEAFDVAGDGSRRERLEQKGMHLYLTPALRYAQLLFDEEGQTALREDVADRLQDREVLEPFTPEGYLDHARALLLDWLEGRPTMSTTEINDEHLAPLHGMPHLYSLMDYRPWSRIYGYLLSGVSALARRVGYRGLVVLVDEAERYALLSKENRRYATYVMKALSTAAVGSRRVPFESVELEELGGWGIQQDLPPRYENGSGLYSVFAMTPDEQGVDSLSTAVPPEKIDELEAFDDHDYRRLASKVSDFYASAHPDWKLTERLVSRVTNLMEKARRSGQIGNPRAAMKFVVEVLDLARHLPESLGGVAEQIERDTIF